MTTLRDRLGQLADDAPGAPGAPGTPDAADADGSRRGEEPLWLQGRRLQRRRQAATALVAAVLVLVIGSLTTLVVGAVDREPVPPADADAALTLPDELYLAGPWSPGTEDTGPIGPLVALVGAERRSFWSYAGIQVAGVSTAGDYAFLDLEDRAVSAAFGTEPQLSPDGRWVAYPLSGTPTGEPCPAQGDKVTGVAVYDTVSGETTRAPVATTRGLDDQRLVWIGDTLVFTYGQYESCKQDGSSRGRLAHLRWDLSTGDIDVGLDYRTFPDLYGATPYGDRVVVATGRRSFEVVAADGAVEPGPRLDVTPKQQVFISPGGARVAANEDPDGARTATDSLGPVVVADATGRKAGTARRVLREDARQEGQSADATSRSSTTDAVVGWRDDETLVIRDDRGYATLEVSTGRSESLVRLPPAYGIQPQVAADALRAPGFAAPPPGGQGDPRRMVWLGGGLIVLLAGAAFWRSRVRL